MVWSPTKKSLLTLDTDFPMARCGGESHTPPHEQIPLQLSVSVALHPMAYGMMTRLVQTQKRSACPVQD